MGPSAEVVQEWGFEATAHALARLRAMRDEAVAVQAEARQTRRHVRVKSVVRKAGRLERELLALELDIALWDGVHPPLQHLDERLETVEAGLDEVEAKLRVL